MQKDFIAQLLEKPQRETAGSDTASRFDYQKNWAFCRMIRRHMEGADYLVAFEFHDDVVFLEPGDAPTKADFCQVKTSRGSKPRTLSTLTTRSENTHSILGKMCLNFDGICSTYETRVMLISNVAFDFADSDIRADELDPKFRDRIVEKLTAEIPSLTDAHLARMHFMVSGVSIDAMQSFLQGEVMELFKSELGEGHGLNIHSWIRLVQGEIGRKNNYPCNQVTTAKQLFDKKCIGKIFLSESIAEVSKSRRTAPEMTLVNSELKNSGWNVPTLMRIAKQLPTATSDFSDATNLDVGRITAEMEAVFDRTAGQSLSEFLISISDNAKQVSKELGPYSDNHYLWALGILVYHEKI